MNRDVFNIENKPLQGMDVELLESVDNEKTLMLFNDDVNSFDFVIDSLIEVCGFNKIQAQQCATIAHYNGKCPLVEGTYEVLYPMYKALQDRKLMVEIS